MQSVRAWNVVEITLLPGNGRKAASAARVIAVANGLLPKLAALAA
jgi:hypothetical protein